MPYQAFTSVRRLPAGEHHGQLRILGYSGELAFAESVYPRSSATAWHSHEQACFTALLGGSYREEFRSGALECAPGNLLFRPAEAAHRDHIGPEGARCLIVELSPAWTSRMRQAGVALDTPRQAHEQQWFLARVKRELAQPDDLSPLALEGVLLELAASFFRVLRGEAHRPRWLVGTRDFLQAEFRSAHRLAELAARAGIHPAHLARAFRRHYGCTMGDFLRRRRVDFACQQLSSGSHTLAEIALAAGFASQAHFSRVFKALTGTTPGQYRARVGCNSRTKRSSA